MRLDIVRLLERGSWGKLIFMYRIAVLRDFIASHQLIGGDWGRENQLHAHHYRIELRLSGPALDRCGYLVDLVDVEAALDRRVDSFRDRILNECPEFFGLNPSLEHFARIFCEHLAADLRRPALARLDVRLWEHEQAWAEYGLELAS